MARVVRPFGSGASIWGLRNRDRTSDCIIELNLVSRGRVGTKISDLVGVEVGEPVLVAAPLGRSRGLPKLST